MLSALTLSRHRSAIRKNRPYGWCVALMVSALQLAPFVEMVDKLGDGVCWGLREEDLSSPLASVMSSIVMQTYPRPVELQVDAKSGKAFVFLNEFLLPRVLSPEFSVKHRFSAIRVQEVQDDHPMQKWKALAMERTWCAACASCQLQVYHWSCCVLPAVSVIETWCILYT